MVLICVSISPESVGAYRIRPDVGEQETTAASKLSLKACRGTQQGFPARKSVAAERSKVSMLVKVLPQSAEGFPTRENLPLEPSKLFPPGEMFP